MGAPDSDPRNLFVGGIRGLEEGQVRDAFARFGTIAAFKCPRNFRDKLQGIAFVSYEKLSAAQKALELKEIDGKSISVSIKVERSPDHITKKQERPVAHHADAKAKKKAAKEARRKARAAAEEKAAAEAKTSKADGEDEAGEDAKAEGRRPRFKPKKPVDAIIKGKKKGKKDKKKSVGEVAEGSDKKAAKK